MKHRRLRRRRRRISPCSTHYPQQSLCATICHQTYLFLIVKRLLFWYYWVKKCTIFDRTSCFFFIQKGVLCGIFVPMGCNATHTFTRTSTFRVCRTCLCPTLVPTLSVKISLLRRMCEDHVSWRTSKLRGTTLLTLYVESLCKILVIFPQTAAIPSLQRLKLVWWYVHLISSSYMGRHDSRTKSYFYCSVPSTPNTLASLPKITMANPPNRGPHLTKRPNGSVSHAHRSLSAQPNPSLLELAYFDQLVDRNILLSTDAVDFHIFCPVLFCLCVIFEEHFSLNIADMHSGPRQCFYSSEMRRCVDNIFLDPYEQGKHLCDPCGPPVCVPSSVRNRCCTTWVLVFVQTSGGFTSAEILYSAAKIIECFTFLSVCGTLHPLNCKKNMFTSDLNLWFLQRKLGGHTDLQALHMMLQWFLPFMVFTEIQEE